VLRVKLCHLESALARRREIAGLYRRRLEGAAVALPEDSPGHSYHLFVIRTPHREKITSALDRAEIGWGVHYEPPVHRMDAYGFLEVAEGALPVTEQAAREVLSLPLHPGLCDADVERVAEVVRDAAGEA
jgi:dTDP-4-amino-4,6-dideoxygalactose transaminase